MLKTRILFLSSVIILGGLFLFPVWKISLSVPQYPKEIFIRIWISKIENGSKKAIEIMNVLNHNIGMKEIDPKAIPELRYFPWGLGILILIGLVACFTGKRYLRIIYLTVVLILILLSVFDFYLWEFHYGHHLAPDAPIQLETGSFQPPLIGQKNISNFIVRSIPLIGTAFPVVSLLGMSLAIIKEKK
jgi:copper chaperone NosL